MSKERGEGEEAGRLCSNLSSRISFFAFSTVVFLARSTLFALFSEMLVSLGTFMLPYIPELTVQMTKHSKANEVGRLPIAWQLYSECPFSHRASVPFWPTASTAPTMHLAFP